MIAALRQQVGSPVMLSVGLHGLFVAALAVAPWEVTYVVEENPPVMVGLVDLESALPPEHALPQKLPVPQKAVGSIKSHAKTVHVSAKRTVTHSRRWARTRVPHVNMQAVASAPTSPVQSPSPVKAAPAVPEPIPSFKELPRPAFMPASFRNPGRSVEDLPDTSETVASALSVSDFGAQIQRRPDAQSSRLLRDTVAETSVAKSKVRPGNNLRPEYPRLAREAGWEGTVLLRVEVLPDGSTGSVAVHKTSGHHVLDEAALSAVQRWWFVPAMDGNFPIRSVVQLPVKFDLRAQN